MNLDIVPDHLPVIAAQLGISAADLMQMLGSVASASIPLPPGLDDVSACIPEAFGNQAARVLPCTANGVAHGVNGAEKLPEVGVSFAVTDTGGGAQVLSSAVIVGK
ncbi:PE domain-containing protein [Nocardia pseudovaccinii]|uniref:PE domain-containing protein n=1 Tax=Nocardia pseudovaccinii TaxID=189540 RepID=UPI0007A5543F|nr:PE domain-containing protein [Nocardia pseudovaccinii]